MKSIIHIIQEEYTFFGEIADTMKDLKKYDNLEIKIFDNFSDIEAKYEVNDIITTIKKDNTGIELK